MRRVAICCGDPSGLGPELIERCLSENDYGDAQFVVFGSKQWVDHVVAQGNGRVEGVALSERVFHPGKPEPDGAKLAMAAMEAAAESCVSGRCDSVVTGPISKALCAKVGYQFPGQTEFFAARWGGEPTMAFVGERLKVCLSTWHIPLKTVAESLDEETFKHSVCSAAELGRRLGITNPKILVCGLNPHAGEGGLLGSEEIDSLNPWLAELRPNLEAVVEDCVPGDTAFARAMKGEADVVVALYHDQGLAPFKAVDFDSGVNVTLGLKYLRVSPDHGTGFEIAGKGIASSGSTHHAIRLACSMK
ncbi:4-hydroxythreonine-4-phosphate dehydrogenase PdxA [Pelagicoccus albus]|uniref:4-hydroxythreonine-4-phosphate dehydrogenase PdxA n=1 Tax=Pelagicoccus albus TaxID=415222 RepID=A0A7X1BB35_9BACT|nr:4-hydroxythreonine-4-phosphate dehydrogenase PdxA [Pelagicoccus albus]MBC2607710.1 4-hydroxythreonine-4-phosphate dehydrogenase PdxA [Pelagicoccus albus]